LCLGVEELIEATETAFSINGDSHLGWLAGEEETTNTAATRPGIAVGGD
jgi:hypothetical protein